MQNASVTKVVLRSRVQRRIWLLAALAATATAIYLCAYAAMHSSNQQSEIGGTDVRSLHNRADEALLRSDVKAYAHALAQAVEAEASADCLVVRSRYNMRWNVYQ